MQWFVNLPMMKKLMLCVGVISVLIGVIGYMGVREMGMTTIATVSGTAIVLLVGMGYFVGWLIVAPLQQAVTVLRAAAAGDLTQHLELSARDELGQMASALNQALDSMRTAMAAIGRNAQ